jgi:hypothetical protein
VNENYAMNRFNLRKYFLQFGKFDPEPGPAMFKEFRTIKNMTAGVKNAMILI